MVMQNLRLNILLTFFLSSSLFSISCSKLETNKEESVKNISESSETKKENSAAYNEILTEFKEQARTDFRKIYRDELQKELLGISSLPPELKKNQRNAKLGVRKKIVVGRIEWVKIGPDEIPLKARIDTGAKTSSLHAKNIKEFVEDGKKYVQFETYHNKDDSHIFKKEVIKTSKVRSSNGAVETRYVVPMEVKLAERSFDINVNLNDRDDLKYNFLVGRNLLMGYFVVDVSQSRILGKE